MWEHIGSRDVKSARKVRRCHWCGELIEIGQPYHLDTGKWEGEFVACYVHPECDKAIERSALEDGYRAYEQIRGLDTEQEEAYLQGAVAWDTEQPREPPRRATRASLCRMAGRMGRRMRRELYRIARV